MITPSSRKQFENHIYILIEALRTRRYNIPKDKKLINSLSAVSKLPNGRVNFHTVDEKVRLSANHYSTMSKMDMSKFIKDEE